MLGVSRSGYYCFTKRLPSQRKQEEERLPMKIQEIYEASRQTYGSPRIHAELKYQGSLFLAKNYKVDEKSWDYDQDDEEV